MKTRFPSLGPQTWPLLLVAAGTAILAGIVVWRGAVQMQNDRADNGDIPPAAFAPDPELFSPVPPPQPGDWLAGPGRNERPRTFEQYVQSNPKGPTRRRTTIVIQPLGAFTPRETALIEKLCAYCAVFFGLPARIEKPRPLPQTGRRRRTDGPTPFDQYLTTAIMDEILRPNLPDDAICYLGVTMQDLYPEPDWNFVFGQASLRERVGVYSLARYRPEFYGRSPDADADKLILMRAIKVMVHETGHMFGLRHCRTWRCVMNGSNHLAESDSRPVFLCPECLRKLQWNLRFDIMNRYEKMAAFWAREGFEGETQWLRRRIEKLRAIPPAQKRNGALH